MADDEEGKRLLRLAKMADAETENPDEAKIPWAAGINPFKKDEDDMGMTPEEFLKLTKEKKDLPEFAMIKVGGANYLDGTLKVKVPAENEKGYEIVPMNKYTDPLNVHPSERGGKHKVYPVWEQMADNSTPLGDPKSVVAVGYGADVRGFATTIQDPAKPYPFPETDDLAKDLKKMREFYSRAENRQRPASSYTERELDQAEQVFSVRFGGHQMRGKRPIPKSAPQREVPSSKNRSEDLDRVLSRMKK